MPLTDGLAALEGPRWLALLNGGVGAAPPKRPTGREFRRVAAIQARTLSAGQTLEST